MWLYGAARRKSIGYLATRCHMLCVDLIRRVKTGRTATLRMPRNLALPIPLRQSDQLLSTFDTFRHQEMR